MKDNNRKSTAKFKLRRRTLYTNKATKQARKELQEAPSYGSNIALNLDPTAKLQKGLELTVLNEINFDECKAILKDCEALLQDPITRPQVKSQVFDQECSYYNFLIWDTETTTIGKSAELIQVSIVSKDEQFSYSEYITPQGAISPAASNVHGLTSEVLHGVKVLCKDGKKVHSVSLQECLIQLLSFIEKTREHYKKETNKPVITVMLGHNSSLFDTPVLLRSAGSLCVEKLMLLDVLFADSLLIFKSIRKSDIPSSEILSQCKGNKLTTLYSHLFNESFDAHDAVEYVKALIKIVFKSSFGITSEQVFSFGQAVTAKQANDDMKFLDQRHARTLTYRRMCFPYGRSVISDAMKQKLAIRGISYENLEQI